MEDAAGVVRRIILLWCEVIIPPCPPSLSCSQVYFWLAALCMPASVCVGVCVREWVSACLPFSLMLTAKFQNSKHGEKQLAPLLFVILTSGQRRTRYVWEWCGIVGGVMFVSVIMFLLSKLKNIQNQKKLPRPFSWPSLRHEANPYNPWRGEQWHNGKVK